MLKQRNSFITIKYKNNLSGAFGAAGLFCHSSAIISSKSQNQAYSLCSDSDAAKVVGLHPSPTPHWAQRRNVQQTVQLYLLHTMFEQLFPEDIKKIIAAEAALGCLSVLLTAHINSIPKWSWLWVKAPSQSLCFRKTSLVLACSPLINPSYKLADWRPTNPNWN